MKAEVVREELNDNRRVLVIEITDGEETKTERIGFDPTVSNDEIKSRLKRFLNEREIQNERKRRLDELRDIGDDPVGITVESDIDAEKAMDNYVETKKSSDSSNEEMLLQEVIRGNKSESDINTE